MTSTFAHAGQRSSHPDWRAAGLRYHSYSFYLNNRFGGRVQRVSVDAQFSCPNVDGRVAVGGCIYCNNDSFSPSRRISEQDVARQIQTSIQHVERRYPNCQRFIAYFQPASNTYGPVCQLRSCYEQALTDPRVVGLAVGTRPDCVPDEVLDLLSEFAQRTYVSVEYGMQTMHDRSLKWINRGHDHATTVDAITRSRNRGFEIGVHVILGLPSESREEMRRTGRELARLNIDAVKIHNLYAVEGTRLAQKVTGGQIQLIDQSAYVAAVVDLLEELPPRTVIQRLSGDAPSNYLVGPKWCRNKAAVCQAIDAELQARQTWQGRKYTPAHTPPT